MSSEPTSVYRFYKRTCQRVRCAFTVLNSSCAFIIASDRANKVVLWVGKKCSAEDKSMAEHYSILLRRQMPENGVINLITEGKETGIGLDHLSHVLWMTMKDYVKEESARENTPPTPNCPKILYSIFFDESKNNSRQRSTSSSGSGGLSPSKLYYEVSDKATVSKLCTVVPDSYGTVPPMTFPGKQYGNAFLLVVGDQLDLWMAEECPQKLAATAKSITVTISQEKLEGIKIDKKLEPVLFGCNTRYIREGYERCHFLTHFSNKSSFISKLTLHEPSTVVEDLPPQLPNNQQQDNNDDEQKKIGKSNDPILQTFNRLGREVGLWNLISSIDSFSSSLSSPNGSAANSSRNNSFDNTFKPSNDAQESDIIECKKEI